MSFAELPDRHPEQTYLTLLERVSATTELVTGGLGFRFEEGLASGVYLREFVGNGPERLHLQRMVMVFGSRVQLNHLGEGELVLNARLFHCLITAGWKL